MKWFYAVNGRQEGPVSEEIFAGLQKAGAITPDTLVWREGMPEWLPFSHVSATTAAPGRTDRCSQCSQEFSMDDMIHLEGMYVCAACKPAFVQKLKEGVSVSGGLLWRKGKLLIAGKDGVLPDRCVKCNHPVSGEKMPRRLYWHHPLFYLTILVNIIVYCIVAMIARKRALVMISVCSAHRAKRRKGIWIGIATMVLGLGTICASGFLSDSNNAIAIVAGIFLILIGIFLSALVGRYVFARKIDKERVWLGGCGNEFLKDFPEWEG